jgi:hypothetical protein
VTTALIDTYAAGPTAVRQAVAGMSREQQLARPVAGKWSTLEVVCHLADMEAVFAERMKRVIAEDNPTFFDADADRFAAALAYHERNTDEELAIVENTRKQMTRILRSLPANAMARPGTHSTAGPLTLEKLLASATRHLDHHVPFILEKRRALGIATPA